MSSRLLAISALTSDSASCGALLPRRLPLRAARQPSRFWAAASCASLAAVISLRISCSFKSASRRMVLRFSVTASSSFLHVSLPCSNCSVSRSLSAAAVSSSARRFFVSVIRFSSSGSLPRVLYRRERSQTLSWVSASLNEQPSSPVETIAFMRFSSSGLPVNAIEPCSTKALRRKTSLLAPVSASPALLPSSPSTGILVPV